MTRDCFRWVCRDLKLAGDMYRGYTLICLDWKDWRIPAVTSQRFYRRQEAREWVDERIALNREMLMETI